MEHLQNSSYLLGKFVGITQSIETLLLENAPSKGDDWGEQLLPLLQANLVATMEMGANVLSKIPESTTFPDGRVITLTDLQKMLQEVNVDDLTENGIETAAYLHGYSSWRGGKGSDPSDHSYNLGVFMAILTGMELAAREESTHAVVDEADDIFLLLQVNFDATMDLAKKIVATLPQTAVFQGRTLHIEEIAEAYGVLELEKLALQPLDKTRFELGFANEMKHHLGA